MARGLRLLVAALLLFPVRAAAVDGPPLTGYSMASWAEREGIPLGAVRAIVQDREGYLWLGTDSGLLRFDGVRFSTADALGLTDMPGTTVRALLAATDGSLWIGFADRTGVRVIRNGRLEQPGESPLRSGVGALAQDNAGVIWAATNDGVFRLQDNVWRTEPFGDNQPGLTAGALHVGRDGAIWAGTNRGLFRHVASRFERVGRSRSLVRAITEDADGRIWVTDPVTAVRSANDDLPAQPGREASGLEVFADRRANVWVGTAGQGIVRLRDTSRGVAQLHVATVDNGLLSNGVWAAYEDRENNIWLGSQQGITRLTPHTVTPVVDIGVVRAVEADGDAVWAGTASALLRVTQPAGGAPRIERLAFSDVVALHRDGAGTLWIASAGRLARLRNRDVVPVPLTIPLAEIRSITGTRAGLWVADAEQGLFQFDGSTLTPFALPAPLHGRPLRFVQGDRAGRLWLAFDEGRLAYVDPQLQVVELGAAHGFADGTHGTLDTIAEDNAGTIWIGGSGGLTRVKDGQFTSVSGAAGLPIARVTAIALDASSNLWLAGDGAIIRLHADEFTRPATQRGQRMRHTRLDTSHGLGGVPVGSTNERVTIAANGDLWFSTGWGLTLVDPRAAPLHQPAGELPVRIEGALADNARYVAGDGVRLPAGTSGIRIDYTALRLTSPTRIRFRYRLEGFDSDWVDAGTRRQAFYTNLSPGSYRFVVQAEAGDRQWTSASSSWTFAIEPAFVQTRTFYGLVVLALALAACAAWQIRLRHVRQQFALVVAERARLSREIHDTLLQNLAGVAIQCAGISNALAETSPARAQLNVVRREVESYVRDMRQAVWDLRAPVLETHDLAGALREFGARATEGTSIAFNLTMSGRPAQLAAKVENDVLRVGQEAIRNAVRHSGATHVRVDLWFDGSALTLRVSDNGCGFDFSHQADGQTHFGVMGMRERAAELGGRLRIDRPPNGGTDVELLIPAGAHPQRA